MFMKKIILFLFLAAFSIPLLAQQNEGTKIVIGVGNAEASVYHEVISKIKLEKDVTILNTCESHRILVLNISKSETGPEKWVEQFRSGNPAWMIYVKDESILRNECLGEIEKQNKK